MTFEEFVDINPKVSLKRGEEYSFIPMEDVSPGNRYCKATRTKLYEGGGAKFQEDDVIFARITPCLENGKIAQATNLKNGLGFGSTEYFVFRGKNEISDTAYIYYLSLTDIIKKTAEKSMSGASGRQRADIESIRSIELDLPDILTQQKIASILSAYDDLIENNTRRIKILEEMAQTIYKEWFVNFRFPGHEKVKFVDSPLGKIPEGWEVVNLVDVANVDYGYPFNSSEFCKDTAGKPVIRIRDIKNNKTQTFTFEEVDEKYKVINGDIIIGMDGDFFMGKWAGGEAWLNQRNARVRSKSDVSKYYLFHCLVEPIIYFNSTIVGTTVAHLSKRDFDSLKILIPRNKILKDISEILDPIYKEEIILLSKNENLRKTRDLLLPKLMSGQVEV